MPALFSRDTKSLPPMAKNILLISEVQTELDEKKQNCEKILLQSLKATGIPLL